MKKARASLAIATALVLSAPVSFTQLPVAFAAPCPWGTQCIAVTLTAPTAGAVLSGTTQLGATAVQTETARGDVVKVEWWLYHADFSRQVPENGEGKILLTEVMAPSGGTRLDGTWAGDWTVPADRRVTTRDGAYQLGGTRTYTLPTTGEYVVEAHVLDEEWVRSWGGPPGRSPAAVVTIPALGTTPPPSSTDVQVGSSSRRLDGTDVPRLADQLIRYTGSVSPANEWGYEVAVVDGTVSAVSAGQPGMAIPAGGYVLSGHGASATWLQEHGVVGASITVPGGTAPPEAAVPPDGTVPGAQVPIAGLDPQAGGVGDGSNTQQGSGVPLSSDTGKGNGPNDITDTALAGGCHPDYGGLSGACLPPVPPRLGQTGAGYGGMDPMELSKQYTCSDVRALIPRGIEVRVDSLGLDSNQDGVACGEGDL
jgi:hypothetical protein